MADPTQAMRTAIDTLMRERRVMEDGIKACLLRVKLAAKFLVGESNRDAQEVNPNFVQEMRDALEAAVKKLVDESEAIARWDSALQEMKTDQDLLQKVRDATQVERELPDFREILKAKLDAKGKQPAKPYEQNAMYKDIMGNLGVAQQENEDDELQVMATQDEAERSLKCPITQQLLENPVRSLCNHTFTKDAVLQYIRTKSVQGRGVKCPVPGCSGLIKANDLQPDAEKALLVKRHERRQQTRMTQDDDEDEYEDAETIDD